MNARSFADILCVLVAARSVRPGEFPPTARGSFLHRCMAAFRGAN